MAVSSDPAADPAAAQLRLKLHTHVVPELISEALTRLPPGLDVPDRSTLMGLRRSIHRALDFEFPDGPMFADLVEATRLWRHQSLERVLQAAIESRRSVPDVHDRGRQSTAVLHQWCDYCRDHVILPMLVEALGSSMDAAYGTELYILDDHFVLRDFTALAQTASNRDFEKAVNRVREGGGGSIGLAGPRGAGKTTMMTDFLETSRGLGVLVSAPIQYDPREFALYLQASLCRRVLDRADPGWRSGEHGEPLRARFPGALLGILVWLRDLVLILALLALSLIFYVDFGSPRPWEQILNPPGGPDYRLIPAVTLGSYMVMRLFQHVVTALVATGESLWQLIGALLATRADRPSGGHASLRREAMHLLRQAHFLQTHTVGWSGKFPLPLKMEATRTRSFQYAQQPLTYPEIVHGLRRFIELCADAFDSVSIGIDELDKISSAQEAEAFVNQVKGIFGVSGCLFVVSVSEDALATFERRGISVRDAFDSAFDEIVRIEHLDLAETSLVLMHRLPGLPVVFQALCHCVSGGLPRELVRLARRLADFKDRRVSLATVCRELISTDLRSRAHGIRVAAVRLGDDHDISGILDELTQLMDWQTAKDLFDTACRLQPTGYSALDRLRWEAAALCYFYVTIIEIFTDDLPAEEIERHYTEPASFATLAKIGNALGEHPRAAWLMLDRFRTAHSLVTALAE